MFCAQCGNQLEDGAKFCAKCGTRVNSGVGELLRSVQPASEKLKTVTSSAGTALLLAIQPVSVWLTRNKRARILSAFISVLIITTLFLGWASIHIRPSSFVPQDSIISEFLPREIKNMLHTDIYFTITTHDLNNYARGLESISNLIGTSGMAPAGVTSTIRSAAVSLSVSSGFIRFMSMICVFSFAVFLSLIAGNSKKAGLAGQVSTLLTFLISLVFAISVPVINSRLPADVSQGISVSACGWVYITMIMSLVGFLLITVCKRVINDE